MYQYRKHLRGSFLKYSFALIIFMSFIFLCLLGGILLEGESFREIDFIFIGFLIAGLFIFLLFELVLIYFLLLKRFKYINVALTEEAIIYNNKKKKIIIPYEEIISIKYPSLKYLGGWLEIKYNGGKIRLTVVLENIGDFTSKLIKILDNLDKSNVYNEKKSFNFFKTASFSDESWDRMYINIKYMLFMEYLSLFIIIILASLGIIYGDYSLIVGGIFTPVIGYLISEIILGRMFSKRVVSKEFQILPRDLNKEKKIIRICIALSLLLYIFILVFI